jgi:hypothetical protein
VDRRRFGAEKRGHVVRIHALCVAFLHPPPLSLVTGVWFRACVLVLMYWGLCLVPCVLCVVGCVLRASGVLCAVSFVLCLVSCVLCLVSYVLCHVSCCVCCLGLCDCCLVLCVLAYVCNLMYLFSFSHLAPHPPK